MCARRKRTCRAACEVQRGGKGKQRERLPTLQYRGSSPRGRRRRAGGPGRVPPLPPPCSLLLPPGTDTCSSIVACSLASTAAATSWAPTARPCTASCVAPPAPARRAGGLTGGKLQTESLRIMACPSWQTASLSWEALRFAAVCRGSIGGVKGPRCWACWGRPMQVAGSLRVCWPVRCYCWPLQPF